MENPYRYAGYRYDQGTGLYYLQAIYYNPEIGRFLTRDTFDGFENEPLSLNRYIYAGNNPVKFTDPSGHFWQYVIGAIVAALRYIAVIAIGCAVTTSAIYMIRKKKILGNPSFESDVYDCIWSSIIFSGMVNRFVKGMKFKFFRTLKSRAFRILKPRFKKTIRNIQNRRR